MTKQTLEEKKVIINFCTYKNILISLCVIAVALISESAWSLLGLVFLISPTTSCTEEQNDD